MTQIVLIAGSALVGALVIIAVIVARMIYICPPNEVLVFSGGRRQVMGTEGRIVGYRVDPGRARRARADARAGRPDEPDQHADRPQGRRRLLEGRHPAQRPRRGQRQGLERERQAGQRDRALPRPPARGDHRGRARHPRGQPARRAGDADPGGGQPGPREVRAGAAARGRPRPRPARARARHPAHPARLRRQGLPRLDRPAPDRRAAQEVADRGVRQPGAERRAVGAEPGDPGEGADRRRDRDGQGRRGQADPRGPDPQGRAGRRAAGARSARCWPGPTPSSRSSRRACSRSGSSWSPTRSSRPRPASSSRSRRRAAPRRASSRRARRPRRRSGRWARPGRRPATTPARSSCRRSCRR